MTASTEPISPEFIAELYSAIIEGDGFTGLADLMCRTAGATTGGVWILEGANVSDASFTDTGRESMGEYLAHYQKLDIWAVNAARMPRDQVFLSDEHTAESDLVKSEYFNDFVRRYGIRRPMGAVLQLRPGAAATVSFERQYAKKLLGMEDKPSLQRLVPYLKGALQLRLRQRDQTRQAGLRGAALDALTFGAVICDARAEVVFANRAAEALSGAGIVLGRRGQGLSAIVPAETRALASLIHATAKGGPGGVLRLTGKDGATNLLVLVTPLPRELMGDAMPGHCLVSLRSARDRPAFVEATLSALFRLSPAQASIAIALHSGKTPEEIAAERGVKISTLRSHLAEIFARTGAENQRDLIRILGMLPPLRGGARD